MRFALYLASGAASARHNCNVYLGTGLSEALRRRPGCERRSTAASSWLKFLITILIAKEREMHKKHKQQKMKGEKHKTTKKLAQKVPQNCSDSALWQQPVRPTSHAPFRLITYPTGSWCPYLYVCVWMWVCLVWLSLVGSQAFQLWWCLPKFFRLAWLMISIWIFMSSIINKSAQKKPKRNEKKKTTNLI